MSKRTRRSYRVAVDALEGRAVPAIDLSVVGPEIDVAYSAFASALRRAEVSSLSPGDEAAGATGGLPVRAIVAPIQDAVATLASSLSATLAGSPSLSSLIERQAGAQGLGDHLLAIFRAGAFGADDGVVPTPLLPALFNAVEAAVLSSYRQTAGETFVASAPTPAGAPGPLPGPATPAPSSALGGQVEGAVAVLRQGLAASLGPVPTAYGVLGLELGPAGLGGELLSLIAAAEAGSTDGSIPRAQFPILFQSVEQAVLAAYRNASAAVYLDAIGQAGGPAAVPLGSIASPVNAAFATFASDVRTAELGAYDPASIVPEVGSTGLPAAASRTAETTVNLPVFLSRPSRLVVSVDYATENDPLFLGGAVAGVDYVASSGTLTFAPGVTSLSIPINLLPSTATTGQKSLAINFSNPKNATIGVRTQFIQIFYS